MEEMEEKSSKPEISIRWQYRRTLNHDFNFRKNERKKKKKKETTSTLKNKQKEKKEKKVTTKTTWEKTNQYYRLHFWLWITFEVFHVTLELLVLDTPLPSQDAQEKKAHVNPFNLHLFLTQLSQILFKKGLSIF